MECLRCHGLMVVDAFEDLKANPFAMSFHGWRCICCGDILDPVILAHRARPCALAESEPAPSLEPQAA